jgi:hypothetical protein
VAITALAALLIIGIYPHPLVGLIDTGLKTIVSVKP